MDRIITTVFGQFRISGNIATSCGDDDFYYMLPHDNMTNDEIKDYFIILSEFEE